LQAPTPNVVFDESGNFIIFAGLLGIKVSIGIPLVSFEACLLPYPAFQPCSVVAASAALVQTPSCSPLRQVVNLVTNRVARLLGKVENTERFLRVALYQVSRRCVDQHHSNALLACQPDTSCG
jgi:hypothetical protein